MSSKRNVVKNYFYNLLYQILLIVVPLIVTPYISRVLTDVGSGQISYTNSINSYFTLIASLGFIYYGQRQIAKNQDDKYKQSTDFYGIIIVRFIAVALTLLLYLILSYYDCFGDKYTYLMQIWSINIISVGFDISFFFNGNEDFKKTVIRNVIVKIASIISVFIFVKNIDDVWIYVLIQVISTFLGNISLWLYLPKYLVKVNYKDINIKKHIKPAIILFLPSIATSIYTTLDKTLIGIITKSDSENGNYEYADRIVKMVLVFVTSLGTVLIPRNSKRFEEGDFDGVKKNIYMSCRFVMLLGVPAMLGLIATANNFVPWFLGDSYTKVPLLIKVLSPVLIIIGLSNVFGLQFLIPSGEDKKFTIALCIGAISNFIFNIPMIYLFGALGAAIATIFAELLVTTTMLFFIRKSIKFIEILKNVWKYIVSGLVMFIPCEIVSMFLAPSIINTIIIVLIGVITYICCIALLHDSFSMKLLKKATNKIIKVFKRK